MRLLTLGLMLVLAGCAQKPAEPPPALTEAPTCHSKPQCDAMWSQVPAELEMLSGMRLQIVSDMYVQTYAATNFGRMTGSATKIPLPDGSTQIRATFICRYSCGNLNFKAVNLFNSDLKMIGKSFAAPAPSAKPALEQPGAQSMSKQAQIDALKRQNLSYEEYQRRYREIMGE